MVKVHDTRREGPVAVSARPRLDPVDKRFVLGAQGDPIDGDHGFVPLAVALVPQSLVGRLAVAAVRETDRARLLSQRELVNRQVAPASCTPAL
ncbi:MAG: hypothetical protein M3O86_04980 [Actinomycetota bacterium]|nr:hypothetical protein [Actinomycetota bacterium]